MRRRVLLRGIGTGVGVVTAAGGAAGARVDDGAATRSAPQCSAIDDAEIDTIDQRCASGAEPDGEDEDLVEVGDDRLEIAGRLTVPDPCHEAVLSTVELDDDDGLWVVIDVEREAVDVCQACLGRIEYDATIEFEDDLPETVTVTHAAMAGAEDVVEELAIEALTDD